MLIIMGVSPILTSVKKHSKKHRSTPRQSETPSQEEEVYRAKVPVKIRIQHGDTILKEYEDVIEVMFTDTTEEGRNNIANVHYLKNVKGVSTDEAIFLIASKAHEDFAKEFAATLSVAPAVELHIHIKRNGAITYGRYM
jgi:hypothetical protein